MIPQRTPRISASHAVAHTFRLALQYHHSGFLLQAAELYAEIYAIDPLNADAIFLLGVLSRQAKRLKQAAQFVSRAIALNPDQPRFRRELKLIRELDRRARFAALAARTGTTNEPGGQAACAYPDLAMQIPPAWACAGSTQATQA